MERLDEETREQSGFTTLHRGERAPGPGFEPGLTDPESAVLPLDDPGMALGNVVRRKRVSPYHIASGGASLSGRIRT